MIPITDKIFEPERGVFWFRVGTRDFSRIKQKRIKQKPKKWNEVKLKEEILKIFLLTKEKRITREAISNTLNADLGLVDKIFKNLIIEKCLVKEMNEPPHDTWFSYLDHKRSSCWSPKIYRIKI